jgi:hypothetical protein
MSSAWQNTSSERLESLWLKGGDNGEQCWFVPGRDETDPDGLKGNDV